MWSLANVEDYVDWTHEDEELYLEEREVVQSRGENYEDDPSWEEDWVVVNVPGTSGYMDVVG